MTKKTPPPTVTPAKPVKVITVPVARRTPAPPRQAVDDATGAVNLLRRATLQRTPLSASTLHLRAPDAAVAGSIVVDPDNGLADVDARLSVGAIAHQLSKLGWWVPLLRPWASVPLWRLAMAAPFVVDAMLQRASLMTVDGDSLETPRAPRHAAGPSLLHSVCGPQPTSLLVRASLRIVPKTHARLVVTDHGTVEAATNALVTIADDARAICAEGFGTRVAVLADDHHGRDDDDRRDRGAAWAVMGARATASRSITPGDRFAIHDGLVAGHRVAMVPFMQRAAVLLPHAPSSSVVLTDVAAATAAIAAALVMPRLPEST